MDKKIEPTDAMVDEAANALALETTGTALHLQSDLAKYTYRSRARVALRVVLNHPGAAGLFMDDDSRPWEPLNGRRVYVGDEVRQERVGITITGVVVRVDKDGDPWAADGIFIGEVNEGTWYVRRAVQELPTEDGAVIVPAEGREFIGGDGGRLFARLTYSGQLRLWYGVVVNGGPAWAALWYGEAEKITPGTWKVDDQ